MSKQLERKLKKMKKYLKSGNKETTLIQAHVDSELVEALRAKLAKEEVKVTNFFEAAIKAYLED